VTYNIAAQRADAHGFFFFFSPLPLADLRSPSNWVPDKMVAFPFFLLPSFWQKNLLIHRGNSRAEEGPFFFSSPFRLRRSVIAGENRLSFFSLRSGGKSENRSTLKRSFSFFSFSSDLLPDFLESWRLFFFFFLSLP